MSSTTTHLKFKLANAWQLKGQYNKAFATYQEVLSICSNYFPAYVQLGHLMARQNRLEEAATYYDRALCLNADRVDLSFFYAQLGLSHKQKERNTAQPPPPALREYPNGKLNLAKQRTFSFHRSGWRFALAALRPLHNSQGVLFDGYLEDNFLFKRWHRGQRPLRVVEKMKADGVFEALGTLEEKQIVPYAQPWVGFLHNPPNLPAAFIDNALPHPMFAQDIWQKSLECCVGLFTLSACHASWCRKQVGVPICNLIYPAETPDQLFDFQSFLDNSCKEIVQVGWWLRKLSAIYRLPLAKNNKLGYKKTLLVPRFREDADDYLQQLIEIEIGDDEIPDDYKHNTQRIQHLPDEAYDSLFANNIIFIELYDASANTVVVECITRTTPLLINPLPPVVEYLGPDYPFYFHSLTEAAQKACDPVLILATHRYLKHHTTRTQLSADYFLSCFQSSSIYQSL